MNLQQLKYIVAVADVGSITEAARQLYISQPALSTAIKEIETEIKVAIFVRGNHGVRLTNEGMEFLGYARQVLQQQSLLEEKYLSRKPSRQRFAVSAQHFFFTANAFVSFMRANNSEEYDFIFRETTTWKVINDVSSFYSEVGILFFSYFNEDILRKMISENNLHVHELFVTQPCVFVRRGHPLEAQGAVVLEDLDDYPCLTFEQGRHNSFYFAEEMYRTRPIKKLIHVSDRAAVLNFLIGLDGYIIATGIMPEGLQGDDIVALPLLADEKMQVVALTHKDVMLSRLGESFMAHLEKEIEQYK